MKSYKLKEICNKITDGSHNPPKGIDISEYLMLSSKNINNDLISYSEPRYLEKELFESENKRTDIKRGDILLTIVGTVGRCAVYERDGKVVFQRSVAVIKPKKEIVNSRYLMYKLISMTNYFEKEARGVAQKGIYLKQLANTDIKLPNLPIQEKMVKILDSAKLLINKRKEQIKMLDELVKSQFIEMFGYLKDEDKLPLEKCTIFIDYRGKTPTLSESGIRIINAKSVGNGFFKYIDEYISEETYNSWMKRGFPVVGDVLFVTEGHTFGNVCRIPNDLKKFAMGQRVITMQGKVGVLNNIFLAQYMQSMSFRIDIDKYKTGSSAQGIRSKELQKILIPIPNIQLQNQFAGFVNEVDKLKFEMQNSLKELEDNFNSLMQRAFKGELSK
ncbi:restriction endonuclease subunit S [Clostridium botulinum]|uniref:restriction endonuclease subunit S n=1 Tax=Clostridium botulinum TaxID=1491 RepID=UPI0007731A6B|nr:restriction endonuclease subunit S [Clostridium botulinum]NFL38143.1 restriction endonuclease subunit S [Clostridium botulinum]NFL64369.1 restriction endonuclease subunit S [Clostridium botulinum]NFN07916.1 restriction endonuclease subunit S [Clostridium botulinum]NFN24179.1 restriction endonuclease subunit S [Clostridium botulinum]NFN30771.1 restriction endonuclease subunit S [Clostridium botulinum]